MKWLIALIVLLLSGVVSAQETEKSGDQSAKNTLFLVRTIPDGDDVITLVKKGEPAPYTGHLYDQNTTIRWSNWLQQYQELMLAYEHKAKRACQVETDYLKSVAEIDQRRAATVETDLRTRLKAADESRMRLQDQLTNPPWYDTGSFKFGLGAVTASSIILIVLTQAH